MIWVYIIIATTLSYLLCKKECKQPEYYILMLFPIELYGLHLASVTVKPYMLMGIVTIILYVARRRSFMLDRSILLFIFLLILADLLSGLEMTSIMQHLMFILNLIIASCVLYSREKGLDLHSLSSVAIATVIGHGLVFLAATVMLRINRAFPDILAYSRTDAGIFLQLTRGISHEIRMRGFTIDPNGFVVNYLFGGACAFYQAFSKKGKQTKNISAILLFLLIIMESGSRMALICFLLLLLSFPMLLAGRNISRNTLIITGILGITGIVYIYLKFDVIDSYFTAFFTDRATLSSSRGRFTLWSSNMGYLLRTGKLWFGIGQDQIAKVGDLKTAFHNTWLEWIGGCGIFIGGFISVWFWKTAVRPLAQLRRLQSSQPEALPLVLGYIVTLLCISTISNIANISYIFLAFSVHVFHMKNRERVNEY